MCASTCTNDNTDKTMGQYMLATRGENVTALFTLNTQMQPTYCQHVAVSCWYEWKTA
jgi:hypothetical protein